MRKNNVTNKLKCLINLLKLIVYVDNAALGKKHTLYFPQKLHLVDQKNAIINGIPTFNSKS